MRVFPGFEGPMVGWPRVGGVLTRLRPDWTIVLATNAGDSEEREIWSALARADLDELIDRVYCFRAVGHRKSSPEYFQHVLDDLGIDADNAVMVGDDYEADVASANRSGIRAIWFHEDGTERPTGTLYVTIHDLRELPEALELLLQR